MFGTATIRGAGSPDLSLSLPLSTTTLCGEDAIAQVNAWASYGAAEPSVVNGLRHALAMRTSPASNSTGITSVTPLSVILESHVFVLLGGTSELGPLRALLKMGATVVCVARKGKKLAATVEWASAVGAGTLIVPVPVNSPQNGADAPDPVTVGNEGGADVIEEMPRIARWVQGLFPNRTLVVGCYIYVDGEAHVRATMAMDTIVSWLVEKRLGTKVA